MNHMLKIMIKDGDYTISFSGPRESLTPDHISKIVLESRKAIDAMLEQNKTVIAEKTKSVPILDIPKNEEDNPSTAGFKIRDRLPNNAINPADLKIDTATHETAMVRCPFCGQAHTAIICKSEQENFVMVYDSKKKEFVFATSGSITAEEVKQITLKFTSNESKLNFYEDMQGLLESHIGQKSPDVIVEDLTVIHCPVCDSDNPFKDWKDAYYNPLNYFETEHPCIVCGGEMLNYVDKKTQKDKNHIIMKCDKCSHKEVQEVK